MQSNSKTEAVLAYLESLKKDKAPEPMPEVTMDELLSMTVQETPPQPEPEPLNVVIQQVVDNDHPKAGRAVYNKEENLITIYLFDGWTIKSIKDNQILNYINDGQTEWSIARCVEIGLEVTKQRTCKFYTASVEFMDRYAAVEAKDYEFDRPHKYGVCAEEHVIASNNMPNPPCEIEQCMAKCNFYVGETWETIRQVDAYVEEETAISFVVQVTRLGYGTPTYRMLKVTDDSLPVVVETISADEFRDETATVIEKTLNSQIENVGPIRVEEIEIENSEEVKNRYFDYVLAK